MFRWRKWDGSPHWLHECVYLGADSWGDWFGQLPGWSSARPGRELDVAHANVTLLPPSGEWVYTANAAPYHTPIYIDLAWDVRWEGAEPTGIDMDLDVVDRLDTGVYIEDRDEWDEHRVHFGYPLEIVDRLEAVAIDLERRVAASEPPFDEATSRRWFARLAELTGAPA
nr:DUF402 domain-containing protein [Microbacterium ulmi]